jgi:hypothetical protein
MGTSLASLAPPVHMFFRWLSEVARIEEAVPAAAIAGTRHDEHQMRMLDSER